MSLPGWQSGMALPSRTTNPIYKPPGLNSNQSAWRGQGWNLRQQNFAQPPHERPAPMKPSRQWRVKMTSSQGHMSESGIRPITNHQKSQQHNREQNPFVPQQRYNPPWQQQPRRNHNHLATQPRGITYRPSIRRFQPSGRFVGRQNPSSMRPKRPTERVETPFIQPWRSAMKPYYQPPMVAV